MSSIELLKRLGEHFRLIIRSPTHVQIEISHRRYHDIWSQKEGGLRIKLYGNNHSKIYYDLNTIIKVLGTYDYKSTDLSQMMDFERLIRKVTMGDAVYCDAGFNSNISPFKTKLAVIWVHEESIDVKIRHSLIYNTSIEAEAAAINLALRSFPLAPTIYSDCQEAVNQMKLLLTPEEGKDKLFWINRERNRDADKLANLRR